MGMPIRQIRFQLRVVVEPDGDGFHAFVPQLPGLHAAGDSEQEAIKAIREGAMLYVQSLVKHNDPIPMGIVVLDRKHSSGRAAAFTLAKEALVSLFKPHRRSSVEEITVPTNAATC